MTDHQRRRVYGRPPVDGTDEELEEWAREFVDRMVASGSQSDGAGCARCHRYG
jgi:hypothetical protein